MQARAADLYEPPVIEYEPPVKEYKSFGGWYLRGHIGMSNQRVKDLYHPGFATAANFQLRDKNFEAGSLFGVGVGYQVNKYLRVDGVVEYRGETGFHGFDTWTDGNGDPRFNNYSGKKSEWLLMANAYADLGEFNGITPYVGAGIGASRNTIHSFRDAGIVYGMPGDLSTGSPTMAFANAHSQWDLAWALHAGIGIKATDRMTVDLGYSYMNLGKARSGGLRTYDAPDTPGNPMQFRNITSHDFKLGVRYSLN